MICFYELKATFSMINRRLPLFLQCLYLYSVQKWIWNSRGSENGPITCTGPTGPTGSTGLTGLTGPYGSYGPFTGPIRALRDLRAPGNSPETDLTWTLPVFFGTCWSHFPFPPATGRIGRRNSPSARVENFMWTTSTFHSSEWKTFR